MEIFTNFIYKTVNSYSLFQDYIEEKLSSDKNNNRINEGYLINKNYYDYWKQFTDYDAIKYKIRNKTFDQAKSIILKYRGRNMLRNYQPDADQYYFNSPRYLYNSVMQEGNSFVLVDKNFFQLICRDECLKEEGMKYQLDKNNIIFIFKGNENCQVITDDNIIDNNKNIIIPKQKYMQNYSLSNINSLDQNKEQLELQKILLLYAYEQEMKTKINDLTYQEQDFQNYYLISKEWIDEYKKCYHYDEICSMIRRKDHLKKLLNIGYEKAKNNLPLILQKVKFNKKFPQINFPDNLKDNNTFLTETKEVELSNGNKVTFWRNFELVNEDLKNLLARSESHSYDFQNVSNAECLIGSGKVIINISKNYTTFENEYALEIGIINNMDMIYNDEFIFSYKDEEAQNDNLRYFINDFLKFQRDNLLFEINLESELLSRNGNPYGIAFKIPPHY